MAEKEHETNHGRSGVFAGVMFALLLLACIIATAYAMRHWWLPPLGASTAADIDRMMNVFFVIVAIVFVGVHIALAYFIFRYRKTDDKPAIHWHENNKLELVWTTIPLVILLILAIAGSAVWARLAGPGTEAEATVEVTARQFYWQFTYPGPDGEFGTDDDFQTFNDLRLPVDQSVELIMRSDDVLHSFFVPEFRQKQDIVPGRATRMVIEPNAIGEYELACVELCGVGHYNMKGNVTVVSQADFDEWVQAQ